MRVFLAACLSITLGSSSFAQGSYDPLKLPAGASVLSETFNVRDAARQRDIPLRVYRLAETKNAPIVLFSHGLGGSRDMGKYLGDHWAARGDTAVFLQHPGSDDSVWRDAPLLRRMQAMREAASAENLKLRVEDVPAVMNQLQVWNGERDHLLAGTMDLKKIGMSGHSFGAQTTQAVSGQMMPLIRNSWTGSRITAAVIMSPGSPPVGLDRAFAEVKIPWLLMTGTNDVSVIGGQTVESRLAVFPALPKGDKYELVLNKGEHSAFTDRALPGESQTRNPNHHKVILTLSTAFWDAYLKDDAAAKAWLGGPGAKSVLEEGDRWQAK